MGISGMNEKIGATIYSLARVLLWGFTHLICSYRVSGRASLPTTGPLLIVANHLSWYDPLLLGVVVRRRVWFLTKVELFRWPLVGWLARRTGQIPVQRRGSDRAALQQALLYLREGKAVVIFPEGTVERQEQMLAAHPGAALLALRSGTPVLPFAHQGTRQILRFHGQWRPQVRVKIGRPYLPPSHKG